MRGKLALLTLGVAVALVWWALPSPERDAPTRSVLDGPVPTRDRELPATTSLAAEPPAVDLAPEPAPLDAEQARLFTLDVRIDRWSPVSPDEGIAVPGAQVEVGVGPRRSRRRSSDALLSAPAADDGTLRLTLPRSTLDAARARDEVLWLRVSGEGIKPTSRIEELPADDVDSLAVHVRVACFARVGVRLVDARGEPAAGYVTPYVPGANGRFPDLSGTEVAPDGRAELEVSREGSLRVFGRGSSGALDESRQRPGHDLGTGTSSPVDVRFDRELPQPVEVQLSTGGSLRGRVLAAGGHPASGISLDVTLAGWESDGVRHANQRAAGNDDGWITEMMHGVPSERVEVLLAGGGLVEASTVTDAEGRFEVLGLRAAHYEIATRLSGPRGRRRVALTEAPVFADGAPLELRWTHPQLAVRVLDARGAPFAREFAERAGWWSPLGAEWPSEPTLIVARLPGAADALPEGHDFPFLREVGDAEFVAEVDVGERYAVGLLADGAPWRPQFVEVPEGADRIEVVVHAAESVAPGSLSVTVQDPRGEPLERPFRIHVIDPSTGVHLISADSERSRIESAHTWALPPGRYRVEVAARATHNTFHGYVTRPREFGAAAWEGEVVSAATRSVTLRLGLGARLRLRAVGEPDPAWLAKLAELDPASTDAMRTSAAGRVHLSLHRPGYGHEDLFLSQLGHEGTSAAGQHLTPIMQLGTGVTTPLLAAGAFTLVATLPDGRQVRRELELFDGVTTDVTLEFE